MKHILLILIYSNNFIHLVKKYYFPCRDTLSTQLTAVCMHYKQGLPGALFVSGQVRLKSEPVLVPGPGRRPAWPSLQASSIYSVSRGRDCLPPGTSLKCVQLMQYSCIFDRFFSSVLYLLQKVIRSVLLTTTCSEILQFLSGLHFMIDFLLGS